MKSHFTNARAGQKMWVLFTLMFFVSVSGLFGPNQLAASPLVSPENPAAEASIAWLANGGPGKPGTPKGEPAEKPNACSVTIVRVSGDDGCYYDNGQSKATIQVEVAWEDAPGGDIIVELNSVTLATMTRTISPGGKIVSPQVVAFEIPADGIGGTIDAFFQSDPGCSDASTFNGIDPCDPTPCPGGAGVIGGEVFVDYNQDGTHQPGEFNGQGGVEVRIFECNAGGVSTFVATTTSDDNGDFFFTGLTDGQEYRIEFVLPQALIDAGFRMGNNGADSRTSVQFYSSPSCGVEFGVFPPNDFCDANPLVMIPCYTRGDPLIPGSAAGDPALLGFPYNTTGNGAKTVYAVQSEVGTLYGVAYDKNTELLYTSAFVRRHSGMGPLGLGGLYVTDMTAPPATSTSPFLDLTTIGVDVGTITDNPGRGLVADKTIPNVDAEGFEKVGKVGIGDIDISDDGLTLYFTNLHTRKLQSLKLDDDGDPNTPYTHTAGDVQEFDLPAISCPGGVLRPWATKFYNGNVYIGAVCDASISNDKSDLRAYVIEFVPGPNTMSILFDFPLTYPKGSPFSNVNDRPGWYPWTDDWADILAINNGTSLAYPVPMFCDIEFDIDGSIVLGFGDRSGFQFGYNDYAPTGPGPLYRGFVGGDMLRVFSQNGVYSLENNAKAGPTTGFGAGNNQGPGFGEFYNDIWNGGGHSEITIGGLALLPGSGEVMCVMMDPMLNNPPIWSNGVRTLDNQTGDYVNAMVVFQYSNNQAPGTFGKSAGLGDIELVCALPTNTQIGNRVWLDNNQNGIQDPCEGPIADVKVELFDMSGNSVAVATTDANGEYYFDDIAPETDFYIVVGKNMDQYNTTTDELKVGETFYLPVLPPNTGQAPNADINDTDGALLSGLAGGLAMLNGYPGLLITSPQAGDVNHTYDFAFYQQLDCGDLPDDDQVGAFPTNNTDGAGEGVGACHVITSTLKLGSAIDAEIEGAPSADADGDDTAGEDDEDGVTLPVFIPGYTADVTITVMNMTGEEAKLTGFFDWNKDGDFLDADEMVFMPVADGTNGDVTLQVPVPADAVTFMDLGMRFRISTNQASVMTATGLAPNGEVEDYLAPVVAYDWGDLIDPGNGVGNGNYNTEDGDLGPSHAIVPGLRLGATIDPEPDGQQSPDAQGDGADEDGLQLPMFVAGIPADITVNTLNTTGNDAKLTIFIDWNNNGSFLDPGEMYSETVTTGTSNVIVNVTPPIFTLLNPNMAIRARLSTDFAASMQPTGQAPDGEVEDYLAQFMSFDWGDLNDPAPGTVGAPVGTPANHETLLNDNGPRHKLITDPAGTVLLKIGASADAEANGQPDDDAGKNGGGDDAVATDDEDGLDPNNLPLFILTQTTTLNIPVMNMTGQVAKLTLYVDFNKDGDFTDNGEMFSASVPDGATTATINIAVPGTATVGDDIGMRLRLNYSNEPMNPTGEAQSGEVEDYVIQIIGFDYGDLPETYGTVDPNAPRHIVNENLKLGSCVDSELDGQPEPMAGLMQGGDDGDVGLATFGNCGNAGDDENGITFPTPMVAGAPACIEVTAMNMTGQPAVLQVWVDFNGDGDLLDAGEEVVFTTPGGGTIPNGGVTNQSYCFNVPANATFNGAQAMVRARLSPNGGLAPNVQLAPVPFGEIEDFKVAVSKVGNLVWWDEDNDGIQDPGEPGINDVEVELTWLGPDGQLGGGDDIVTSQITSNMGGQDGMFMFVGLTPGPYKIAVIDVPVGFVPTQLNVGNDEFIDADDPAGVMVMIPDPINLPTGEDGIGDNPNDPNFPDPTNDLGTDFGYVAVDYGDLPDTYGTTQNNNGPSMIISPNLYLGSCVDGEDDGQPEPMAGAMINGDDNNMNFAASQGVCLNGDDENGIVLFETPMVPGYPACWRVTVHNTTGEDAVLQAWVDWNGNGTFDGGEQLNTGAFAPNGYEVPIGGIVNEKLCFDVPANATFTGGQAMIRLRLSQDGGFAATGPAATGEFGEVEDYKLQLAKVGNLVWNDYNNDGTQNEPTTAGLNNIEVNLLWAGPDLAFNTPDDQTYVRFTSNMGVDGQYMFTGLIPGPYKVSLPDLPDNFRPTQQDQGSDVTDSDDTDGEMVMILDPINLPTGENGTGDVPNDPHFPDVLNDLTVDFGIITTDYGDLPDTYGTTDGSPNDGPVHTVDPRIKLGACQDGEDDGQPDPMAGLMQGGDDNNDGANPDGTPSNCGDDEDGIVFETPMVPGYEACIRVTAMNMLNEPAVLEMWIDWNGNDQFDAGELVNTGSFNGGSASVPNGGLSNAQLCFTVPANATFTGGSARVRTRISPNGVGTPNGPENMPFPQGEVEDFKLPLAKAGNLVWNDWNNDGVQNEPNNAGLNNVTVELVWAGPDDDFNTTGDNRTYTRNTSNMGVDGMFMFTGLTSGAYKASIPNLPANFRPTQLNIGAADTDSDDPAGVMVMIPDPINLPLNESGTGDNPNDPDYPDPQNDLTFDFGLITTDYGDLPESYATSDATDGPIHVVNPTLKLGACEDGEIDGQPEAMAGLMTGGDDNGTGSNVDGTVSLCGDDEDGIVFETPMIPGYTACIRVTAMNSTGATAQLQMWVDWNGNDQFDAGEAVNTGGFTGGSASIPNGGVNNAQFCFEVPSDATFTGGSARVRFRLSPNGGLPSNGPTGMPFPIGEVEDYKVPLAKVGNHVWIDVNINGQQDEDGILGINDVTVQLEWAGPDGSLLTSGDNQIYEVVTAPKNAQINGIYYFCGLIPGTYEISVPPFGYVPTLMLNVGDDVTDSDDPAGVTITIPDPIANLINGEYGTGDMPGMINLFPDGQDDQTYDFGYLGFDLGDAPESYSTTMGNNGAIHTVNPELYLGPCVDVDLDGQPEPMAGFMAGGDDGNAGPGFLGTCSPAGDDENGIEFPTPLVPGNEACVKVTVTNTTGAAAVLQGWIDFNGNGQFEANEQLTTGDFATNGASIPAGGVTNQNFCFEVPANATFEGGDMFARFRLSDVGGLAAVGPAFPGNGQFPTGEVEDYKRPLALIGNYVWMDNPDIEGDQDPDEMMLADVKLNLIWSGEDGNFQTPAMSATPAGDDRVYMVTTDANGVYEYRGLIANSTYRILPEKYTAPDGEAGALINPIDKILTIPNLPGDDFIDSDAQPFIAVSIPDLVNGLLPTGETGLKDNNGLNGFPDDQEDLSLDLGFIDEPEIRAALAIMGFEQTECGKFGVIMDLCIKNNSTAPLASLQAALNLAGNNAYGTMFERLIAAPVIVSSDAQQNPVLNGSYDAENDNELFNNTSGLLYPGEQICIRIRFEVDPEAVGAPTFPESQASVSALAENFQGVPIPDFWNGGNQYVATDLSDVGTDPMSTNPGFLGDTGGSDDPTPLGDCWETTQTMVCNDHINISVSDEDCTALINDESVMEGEDEDCTQTTYPLGGFFKITIKNEQGQVIPNPVPLSYIGETLIFEAENIYTCNVCWGTFTLEDKEAPQMECSDIVLNCTIEQYSPSYLQNVLGLANAYPDVFDCTDTEESYVDTWVDLACDEGFGQYDDLSAYVERVWTSVDEWGNESQCTQYIVFERLHNADVTLPADVTISCTDDNTSPSATGAPYVEAFGQQWTLWPNQVYCEMSVTYTDVIVPVCDGTYKIERLWRVHDWCAPTSQQQPFNPMFYIQIITVMDMEGPAIACPADITVSTDPFTCCATTNLPDVIITDACSRVNNIEAKVVTFDYYLNDTSDIVVAGGTLGDFPGNNHWEPDTLGQYGFTSCLPLGTHHVYYYATDDCGNEGVCSFELTVDDQTPPAVACDEFTQISLGLSGESYIDATTFDDGSYDNCSDVNFKVRRMATNSCDPSTQFDDQVKFCCDDIGDTIQVVLRVYDVQINAGGVSLTYEEENANDCMVLVFVEDKIKPACLAPANATVSCENFDPSLWAYGFADGQDNCCVDTITTSTNYALFDTLCNKGTITRTFRVFDCYNNSAQCTQRVIVNYEQDYFVKFPNDIIVNECDGTGLYGEPEFYGEDCELLGVSYDDEVFTVVPDACYKIERTWDVINWCTYDPNMPLVEVPNPNPNATTNHPSNLPGPIVSPLGTAQPWTPTVVKIDPSDQFPTNYSVFWQANANGYRYKQIIKIIDNEAPVYDNCPSDVEICDLTENDGLFWNDHDYWDNTISSHDLCEAPSELCVTVTDSCGGAEVNVRYILFLDIDGDGVMETEISSTNQPAPNEVPYLGGTPFDHRPVPFQQKYRFAIDWTTTGNSRTACVRWDWLQQPANLNDNTLQGVVPQLPYGTHKIKWIAEDGCGNEAICEYTFEVKDCKKPTVVCLNGLSVNIMPTGMITLWGSDFLQYGEDNCTPADQLVYGVVKSSQSTGSFPVDGLGNPITNVTFDCSELGPQPVQLWAMDAAGNADFCETYVIVQDNMGNCGSQPISVAGVLATEQLNGLEDANVELFGQPQGGLPPVDLFDISNNTGNYEFSNALPLSTNYVVTPLKDDNPLNGVTTYDLVLISKHILGLQPLNSPYKMIAADANKSNSITTFDIVELRKLILGIYDELPNNTSWRFVDTDFDFTDSANPFFDQFPETKTVADIQTSAMDDDFVSIKVGDVNGSAIANSLMSSDDRSNGTLVFDVKDREVKAGEKFDVTFTAAEQVLGYQFTLNTAGLEVLNIEPGSDMSLDNFGVFADAITTSYNGKVAGTFKVTFRANESGSLSSMLNVSSRITKAEAYNNGQLDIALRFNGDVITGLGFELYQNIPNPWVDKTQIGFHLPAAAKATLTIYDESGRMLFTQRGEFGKGYNVFTIERELIDAVGVLYYRVETDDDAATMKMIQTK